MSGAKCQDCEHLCCNYITVKIPAPRTIRDFDGLLWQLAHTDVQVFRDHSGWHLLVNNPCSYLTDGGKCGIYHERPITCREHSEKNCEFERSFSESAYNFFESYQELDEYCSKRFKTWKKRCCS